MSALAGKKQQGKSTWCGFAAFATVSAHSQEKPEPGEGSLFRGLFGPSLERDYGITVSGLPDLAYVRNNRSIHDEREDGQSNLPLTGMSDEGPEFGGFHIFIDKPLKSTSYWPGFAIATSRKPVRRKRSQQTHKTATGRRRYVIATCR
ncbi:hypothetical protein [Pseudomonas capeferrum]|uniref:hypothetical protein n=1 Tax=Pseudomonas capeferrum TaxID=1495066 RepID=UPI001C611DE3|nr:hypothetical protein [Pseudomonas capeferrum]